MERGKIIHRRFLDKTPPLESPTHYSSTVGEFEELEREECEQQKLGQQQALQQVQGQEDPAQSQKQADRLANLTEQVLQVAQAHMALFMSHSPEREATKVAPFKLFIPQPKEHFTHMQLHHWVDISLEKLRSG